MHACRRGELRELVALIDEPVHGTHRVRVVIAAENGSVGPDPLRDGTGVPWEIDPAELPAPGQQVAMCVHGGLPRQPVGPNDLTRRADAPRLGDECSGEVDRAEHLADPHEAMRPA